MKTTTIIIAAILSFQVTILFAGNNETASLNNDSEFSCLTCITAPGTPSEASFEDDVPEIDIATLAPVTSEEADFSDFVFETSTDLTNLAPFAPAEADFNDDIYLQADFTAMH